VRLRDRCDSPDIVIAQPDNLGYSSDWYVHENGAHMPCVESGEPHIGLLQQNLFNMHIAVATRPLRYAALGTGCAPSLQCLGQLSLALFRGRYIEYQLWLG